MSSAPTPKERRAFVRWNVALKGLCSGNIMNSPCTIVDINESGMSFECGFRPEFGEEVTVEWNLGDADDTPFEVRCVVRHASDTLTGVEFLNLTLPNRVRLLAYLRRISAED